MAILKKTRAIAEEKEAQNHAVIYIFPDQPSRLPRSQHYPVSSAPELDRLSPLQIDNRRCYFYKNTANYSGTNKAESQILCGFLFVRFAGYVRLAVSKAPRLPSALPKRAAVINSPTELAHQGSSAEMLPSERRLELRGLSWTYNS